MTVNLSPVGGVAAQFFDNNGVILSGGKLYTYAAGTTTPATTYTTNAGNVAQSNPIILDSAGRVPSGEIWLTMGATYKFVVKTSADVLIGTYDNISGISSLTLPISSNDVTYTPAGGGAVATTVQTKLREYVTFQDFGAVGNGVADDTAAVQAAITYASAQRLTIFAYGGFKITSTVNFPSNTNGCTIQGQSKQTYFKFTGTGAMFASLSTNSIVLRNLTFVGPNSNIAATALSLQTSDPTVGVYYCVFEDLTIEGFQYGISMAGLCEPVFRKVNIGLNKSGIFTGTPQEGTPLIGIAIGATVLAAQFEGLTIFASQICVSQTTEQQLVEGHYWFGCTFDLSFNSGANVNQSCVSYESGQDIVFTACWFTNSQKYTSTSGPYSDNLVRFAYDAGSITAPAVSLKFTGCTFVGNGMSYQFGNAPEYTREFTITGCVLRLWANLGKIVIGGFVAGVSITGNAFQLYGNDAGGGTAYDLPQTILDIANVSEYTITGNSFGGILPINTAVTYITLGDTTAGLVANNAFPVQTSLTSGNDVTISGTSTNVIVDGWQQQSRKLFTAGVTAGTYNLGSPTVVSIDTGMTKPCNAIIQIYIDDATITNPGAATMLFELEGLTPVTVNKREVKTTGAQAIDYTFTGLVSGTVTFKVNASLQMVVGAGTTAKFMAITFI